MIMAIPEARTRTIRLTTLSPAIRRNASICSPSVAETPHPDHSSCAGGCSASRSRIFSAGLLHRLSRDETSRRQPSCLIVLCEESYRDKKASSMTTSRSRWIRRSLTVVGLLIVGAIATGAYAYPAIAATACPGCSMAYSRGTLFWWRARPMSATGVWEVAEHAQSP